LCPSPLENNGSRSRETGIASLPSSKPALRLEDIIENAERIAEYIDGVDEVALHWDRKTYDAVERCIERVIEATAKRS